jgi:hypothetical protein
MKVWIGDRRPSRDERTEIRHSVEHVKGCNCLAVHHFKCPHCGCRVGWCLGCHDNMPEACDFCWKRAAA